MTKIAVLSDIHGNTRALEAVLADAEKAGVEEYWLLGDISHARGLDEKNILQRLEGLPIRFEFGELGREFMASCSSKIRYK